MNEFQHEGVNATKGRNRASGCGVREGRTCNAQHSRLYNIMRLMAASDDCSMDTNGSCLIVS